jgi:hypothetical protein
MNKTAPCWTFMKRTTMESYLMSRNSDSAEAMVLEKRIKRVAKRILDDI